MLQVILTRHHAEIIERAASRATLRRATRGASALRQAARARPRARFDHGIQRFVLELTQVMSSTGRDVKMVSESATRHGNELLSTGIELAEVVYGYGDICQVVSTLAVERALDIPLCELATFNACLDEAIARAVSEHSRVHELTLAAQTPGALQALLYELRSAVVRASLALELVQDSHDLPTRTGLDLLGESLRQTKRLVERARSWAQGSARRAEPPVLLVKSLLEQVAETAAPAARARDLSLVVLDAQLGLSLIAERQPVASAIATLVHNALAVSLPASRVTVRVRMTAQRVLLSVEDQRGSAATERPFPAIRQADLQAGAGMSVLDAQQAIEASGGLITVQHMPGIGCAFTIELPRGPDLAPLAHPSARFDAPLAHPSGDLDSPLAHPRARFDPPLAHPRARFDPH